MDAGQTPTSWNWRRITLVVALPALFLLVLVLLFRTFGRESQFPLIVSGTPSHPSQPEPGPIRDPDKTPALDQLPPQTAKLTPADFAAELSSLRGKFALSFSPEEWLKTVPQLHRAALDLRGNAAVLGELKTALTDRTGPGSFRCVVALILGTLSPEVRQSLGGDLLALDGDVAVTTLYALGLRDMRNNVPQTEIQMFWLGAAITLGSSGILAPGYDRIYENRLNGLPEDSILSRSDSTLPTKGFESYLSSIDAPDLKRKALEFIRQVPGDLAIRASWRLLAKKDTEVTSLSRELFARPDIRDPSLREILVGFAAEGKQPEEDLLWMLGVEPNAAIRLTILNHLQSKTDPRRVAPELLKHLTAGLDEQTSLRVIQLLGSMHDTGVLARLQQYETSAGSEAVTLQVISSIAGNSDAQVTNARLAVLQSGFRSESARVREESIRVLGTLGVPAATQKAILSESLARESDENVKRLLLRELASLKR
jgi:hypothetical protein